LVAEASAFVSPLQPLEGADLLLGGDGDDSLDCGGGDDVIASDGKG